MNLLLFQKLTAMRVFLLKM